MVGSNPEGVSPQDLSDLLDAHSKARAVGLEDVANGIHNWMMVFLASSTQRLLMEMAMGQAGGSTKAPMGFVTGHQPAAAPEVPAPPAPEQQEDQPKAKPPRKKKAIGFQ